MLLLHHLDSQASTMCKITCGLLHIPYSISQNQPQGDKNTVGRIQLHNILYFLVNDSGDLKLITVPAGRPHSSFFTAPNLAVRYGVTLIRRHHHASYGFDLGKGSFQPASLRYSGSSFNLVILALPPA
jgi:hypothetical protein